MPFNDIYDIITVVPEIPVVFFEMAPEVTMKIRTALAFAFTGLTFLLLVGGLSLPASAGGATPTKCQPGTSEVTITAKPNSGTGGGPSTVRLPRSDVTVGSYLIVKKVGAWQLDQVTLCTTPAPTKRNLAPTFFAGMGLIGLGILIGFALRGMLNPKPKPA